MSGFTFLYPKSFIKWSVLCVEDCCALQVALQAFRVGVVSCLPLVFAPLGRRYELVHQRERHLLAPNIELVSLVGASFKDKAPVAIRQGTLLPDHTPTVQRHLLNYRERNWSVLATTFLRLDDLH